MKRFARRHMSNTHPSFGYVKTEQGVTSGCYYKRSCRFCQCLKVQGGRCWMKLHLPRCSEILLWILIYYQLNKHCQTQTFRKLKPDHYQIMTLKQKLWYLKYTQYAFLLLTLSFIRFISRSDLILRHSQQQQKMKKRREVEVGKKKPLASRIRELKYSSKISVS